MIKRATSEDVDFIVALGEQMFAMSHWAGLTTYDRDRTRATLEGLADREDAAIFVTAGGVLIVIEVPLIFSALKTVQELFFWALDGSGTALRAAAEEWARTRAAVVPIIMGAHEPGDMTKTERWYRRAGYEPYGRTFRKVLTDGN